MVNGMCGIVIDYKSQNVMKHELPVKSCEHCKHASIERGSGYDEPPWEDFDCGAYNKLSKKLQNAINGDAYGDCTYEYFASLCRHFEPFITKKCGCCGLELNVPSHLWPLWAQGPGIYPVPVCSAGCAIVIEAKGEDYWEQCNRDNYRRYDKEASE